MQHNEHQDWEKSWWGSCCNTFGEEQKQLHYAQRMGLKVYWDAQGPHIDMQGKSVVDIGGGPVSLLLKCVNVRGTVIDPCKYPDWTWQRYVEAGITVHKGRAEDEACFTICNSTDCSQRDVLWRFFDECWIYNVLQHVEDPEKIIQNARKCSKIIRVFDWLEIGVAPGHPHNLHKEEMDRWFGGEGQTAKGNGGIEYYGVFIGIPKVAVCIATYNMGEFLPDLLDSLKNQTYKNFTVYVTYNGSTDNTLEILTEYQKELPIVIGEYNPQAGIGLNKRDAVSLALRDNPQYIQMIDADDIVKPTFVEKVVERMQVGDVDWCICWGHLFGDRTGYIHSEIESLDNLKKHNNLHSWGTFKANVLRNHNYNPKITYAEDWDLWIRLTEAGYKGDTVNEELYMKRWHDKSLTVTTGG